MSDLFKLNWKDLLNGILMAVIGNVVVYLLIIFTSLYELVMKGLPFDIKVDGKSILVIAIFSFLSYIAKRFFSGSTGTVLIK